jgi:hypothetical protein
MQLVRRRNEPTKVAAKRRTKRSGEYKRSNDGDQNENEQTLKTHSHRRSLHADVEQYHPEYSILEYS